MLEFTCDEFPNWDRHLVMIYDNEFNEIIKTHNTGLASCLRSFVEKSFNLK